MPRRPLKTRGDGLRILSVGAPPPPHSAWYRPGERLATCTCSPGISIEYRRRDRSVRSQVARRNTSPYRTPAGPRVDLPSSPGLLQPCQVVPGVLHATLTARRDEGASGTTADEAESRLTPGPEPGPRSPNVSANVTPASLRGAVLQYVSTTSFLVRKYAAASSDGNNLPLARPPRVGGSPCVNQADHLRSGSGGPRHLMAMHLHRQYGGPVHPPSRNPSPFASQRWVMHRSCDVFVPCYSCPSFGQSPFSRYTRRLTSYAVMSSSLRSRDRASLSATPSSPAQADAREAANTAAHTGHIKVSPSLPVHVCLNAYTFTSRPRASEKSSAPIPGKARLPHTPPPSPRPDLAEKRAVPRGVCPRLEHAPCRLSTSRMVLAPPQTTTDDAANRRYVAPALHHLPSVTLSWQLSSQPKLTLQSMLAYNARRRNSRLAMLYKMQHGLACVSCDSLNPLPASNTRRRRGHSQQYQQLSCRTNYRFYSFLPRTIRDWNSLPEDIVQSPSLATFVSMVSNLA
ncbi:hypothetical protein Bbelb_217200 [Branchiostoma belcheri]|nr:hypothetical protein Bbelb_217200 [Branchiostoma belcheri]